MRGRWISEYGKGPGEKQTCEGVKRMEKYMLVQDGKVVVTIEPGEQEEK